MDQTDAVVIVSAQRSAIGNLGGGLSKVPAHEIGAQIIQAALQKAGLEPTEVDDVILGQVLTAGAGQNPARQAAIAAGIGKDKTALTINQVCGSGLRAVAMGAQAILCGDANVVVAGGQENMSLSPHALMMREGVKFGDASAVDTMIKDGLWDAFHDYHMGITAENVAHEFSISREQQDAFAANSQQKAQAAIEAGAFDEEISRIVIETRKGQVIVDKDEFPRAGVTAEGLSGLRTAFKKDGTVTAGNASGINDGAAALILMRASHAEKHGIKPMAKIASWATHGVSPSLMGTGPIPASQEALRKAGWGVDELDLIEANEAFAAQACAVNQALGFDLDRVNVNGGAIALGHPIGASGARVLVTLLHALQKRKGQKGLATLCIGGGMGIAMCVEAL